jgi:hypothetical protein
MQHQEFKTLEDGIKKYLGEQMPTEQEEFKFNSLGEIVTHFKSLYSGIIPNPNEYTIAIADAFKMAEKRLENERKVQAKLSMIEHSKKMFTFDEMKKLAISVGKRMGELKGYNFEIDDYNKHQFDLLCYYFTNDPKFEEYGLEIDGVIQQKYDLKKGIWIQSDTRGTGKSELINCFKFNKRQSFNYVHTAEMRKNFQQDGYDGIEFFMKEKEVYACNSNFHQSKNGWLYDELFAENKANYMGTPEVISEYIINTLYDFSQNHRGNFWKFHCTSNGDGKFIEEKNGKNYRSRMSEMFNMIKLDGPDRRKQIVK